MNVDLLAKRQPDFDNLRRAVLRQGPPGSVPFFELGAEPAIIGKVLGERVPLDYHIWGYPRTADLVAGVQTVQMFVEFYRKMGYDFVPMYALFNLPRARAETPDNEGEGWTDGIRVWQDETTGPIQSWEDFEKYHWPKPEETDYSGLEFLNAIVPEGMKICANLLGILDNTTWLMGFQTFYYALYDQPDLVEAVMDKVTELSVGATEHVVTIDNVEMVLIVDEMGYNKGTVLKPDMLRKYVYPRHRHLVDITHEAGKLFILHSCGNLTAIMDEVIEAERFDAKHSFEDAIMPVEEVYRRWGDRTSVLGGVDMDILARGTEEQVRKRVRQILDVCGQAGTGFCLGSGNSITNYIPVENYLAMLDEGHRWNREHFGTT